jgi:hypothetical protein
VIRAPGAVSLDDPLAGGEPASSKRLLGGTHGRNRDVVLDARLAVFVDLVSGLLPPHLRLLPIARPIAPAAGDARAEDVGQRTVQILKTLGVSRREAEKAQRRTGENRKSWSHPLSEPPAATDQARKYGHLGFARAAGRSGPLGAGQGRAGAGGGTRTPTPRRLDLNQVRLPIPPHPHTWQISCGHYSVNVEAEMTTMSGIAKRVEKQRLL